MSLTSNTNLGPYTITSPLGAGGMGEVYRARDTRLDRDVAIKVLPDSLAKDAERILRFEREAKVLASLNHPNIAAVYGFEESAGKRFLVMELAEGESLADRLARGPIPVRDTLEFAVGIALGLEAAHDKGIIHRDLKPANVKVTPDGTVKVLDFGLAKAMTGDATGTDIANSPTITLEHTRPGVVLGTAAYMSPEQARGRMLDKRTDVWSFGCVVYECLTGRRPFDGETTSDLVARILEREPDWSALPAGTPPLVQLLLRRCLAKDRNRRLRDIGDARVEIEAAIHDPTTSGLLLAGAAVETGRIRNRRRIVGVGVSLVVAAALFFFVGWDMGRASRVAPVAPTLRFTLDVPAPYVLKTMQGDDLAAPAISPDGSTLAIAVEHNGRSRIMVRKFSEDEPRLLPETEDAKDPFFSPDGRWIGFLSGGTLKKAPVGGGPSLTIAEIEGTEGAWLDDGSIVLDVTGGRRLVQVREGAPLKVLATAGIDQRTSGGEQPLLGFQTICAIPGADYVLAGIWDGDTIEDYAIVGVSLKTGEVRPVVQNAVQPRYAEPGVLYFLRGASILAVPFDKHRGLPTGEETRVIDGVMSSRWADKSPFAVSLNGTIVYVPGDRLGPGRRLIRVDAAGKSEPIMDGTDAIAGGPRLSPDAGSLTLMTLRRSVELWRFHLTRKSFTLINKTGETWGPVWSPDGQWLYFLQVLPEKFRGLVRKRADGGGDVERIPHGDVANANLEGFTPDGKFALLTLEDADGEHRSDIGLLPIDPPGAVSTILGTPANETAGGISPDGKFYTYVSDETGDLEIYARAFPNGSVRWQVSQGGGHSPVWSRDGKNIYFLHRGDVMQAVDVTGGDPPTFSMPRKMFDLTGVATTHVWGQFDVLPDGSFVMVAPAEWELEPTRLHVVINGAPHHPGGARSTD